MKALIILAMTLAVLEARPAIAQETMAETRIQVSTIKCNSCVKTITTALKSVDGVGAVKIDLKEKVAFVQFDSTKVKIVDLESAIAKAGYDANHMKRNSEAYDELDKCCR